MSFLKGLCAFPITPADRHGHVDAAGMSALANRLADARVDSIGVLGSTGIYMYLARAERRRALEAARAGSGGRIPIVAGIGALRTDEAVACAQDARAIGAVAGLLPAVSYTPLGEDEVFEHFATVAREGGLPVIIYDNPATTHFRFTPALVGRLAQLPGIIAIKNPGVDAAETAHQLAAQRAIVPRDFSIGCSADWTAAETMLARADVWYSVLAGVLPDICLEIVRAARQGDAARVRQLDGAITPLWELFRQFSSLRVVYALADLLGICRSEPPRPILPLPDPAKHRLAGWLSNLHDTSLT